MLASEAIHGAALAFGRTPTAGDTGSGLRLTLRRAHRRRGEILVQQPPRLRIAAAFRERRHFENTDRTVERDREDIARFDGVARSRNPRAIHPHMAGASKRGCRRACAHDAGVPQPLIYALTVQIRGLMIIAPPWPRAGP